jgi:hypothetical protein
MMHLPNSTGKFRLGRMFHLLIRSDGEDLFLAVPEDLPICRARNAGTVVNIAHSRNFTIMATLGHAVR